MTRKISTAGTRIILAACHNSKVDAAPTSSRVYLLVSQYHDMRRSSVAVQRGYRRPIHSPLPRPYLTQTRRDTLSVDADRSAVVLCLRKIKHAAGEGRWPVPWRREYTQSGKGDLPCARFLLDTSGSCVSSVYGDDGYVYHESLCSNRCTVSGTEKIGRSSLMIVQLT